MLRQRLFCLSLLVCIYFAPINSIAQYTKLLDMGSTGNGANPYGTPVSDGTYLYGTTVNGGAYSSGTIYKIKKDGTGFTVLLDFDGSNGDSPYGALYFDGTFLYGMTSHGGANGYGLLFKIKTDGTGYVDLLDLDFTSNGAYPTGGLISDGTYLFGMTTSGGTNTYGTIFKIKLDGSGYTNLHNFTNTDGSAPYGSLNLSGSTLYGMTNQGGSNNSGTLFTINTDGTGFATYFNFTASSPKGSLVSDGTYLYGMTWHGGTFSYGQIFKIKLDGTGGALNILDLQIGSSGAYPCGSLVYDGSYLYGMTTQSIGGNGTIFKLDTNGGGYTKLLDVDMYGDGANPQGTLLLEGSTLYGVRPGISTNVSGISYLGTIFKINTDGSNYTKLYNYEVGGNSPEGSFLAIGTALYGTTFVGGQYNYGTLFKVNADGTGYTKILDFDGTNKGKFPHGKLIYDGTYLYGTTTQGGASYGVGVLFKVKPDGTGFVDLLDFDDTNNGADPRGALLYDGTYLYGMTSSGGATSNGTIFKILPNGTGYTKLIDLDYTTNGSNPYGSLIDVGGVLYGLTRGGGANDEGVLFKINKDGTGFSRLIDFDYTNSGATPYDALYSDGTFLYGTTSAGGANSNGTIFKVKTDGSGYTKLLDFDGTNTGGIPKGSLISDDGVTLYGLTSGGGALGHGAAFSIKTDGTNFLKLYDFGYSSYPQRSLLSDGTFLYGLTEQGGGFGLGTAFKLTKTPFVSITKFDPGLGAPGTVVTISGTSFDPVAANNTVKFNNTVAVVKSSTSSTIVAVVPVGATSGPISVKAGTTGVSDNDFSVVTNPEMINGTVQSCNFQFSAPSGSNDLVETFLPVNPGDKIQVSFSSFKAMDDQLNVYDGPSTSSPLIASLNGLSIPADIVATGPGGELTFEFVWGDGASSIWLANISCQSTAPTISIDTQPADFTVCAGGTATFTTSASGTTNITYQWQYSPDGIVPFSDVSNGVNYSNVATATLSVNTVGSFGAGRYRCKIDGDLASTVLTDDEGLFINPLPSTPTTSNVNNCGPGNVTLTASGGTNGNYLWYDANGLISGQTNSTYITLVISSTATYSVAVTDGACTSAKANADAIINNIPTAPTSLDVNNCGPGSVSLSASGGSNGNYLWYDTNGLISGQVNSTYVTPVISTTTTYSVAITNGSCNSTKVPVTATINTVPTAPGTQGASACSGNTFTLTASGGTNGQYVWYTTLSGGSAITGQVNSTYTTPSLTTTTSYYVSINNGTCESTRSPVTATVLTTGCNNGQPPVIAPATSTTLIGSTDVVNLLPLLSDPDNNLDLTTLKIVIQPTSGATATIDANHNLVINYKGLSFAGTDHVTIEVCDLTNLCVQKVIDIEVDGDITVFNGLSPNGANPKFIIQNIESLPETKNNTVHIFDRWENLVWHGTNYDNKSVVFTGVGDGGSDLPSGVYYYKINFSSGRKTETGFISLRRQ